MDALQNLQIRFQSAAEMPPPYTHFYTLTVRPLPDRQLEVAFSITYTDRDELDADEIIAEGFTADDDFDWKGKLPAVGHPALESLVSKTRLQPLRADRLPNDRDFFELTIGAENDKGGQPANQPDWQYLTQELIQAIYEAAGRERPFELTFVDIQRGTTAETQLTASFVKREVQGKSGQRSKNLPWAELQPLMSEVYGVQYLYEEALPKLPKRDGQFLNLGEELWFELGRAVVDLDEPGAVARLRKALRRLAE